MCRAGQDRLVKEGVEWCLQQLFLSEVSQFLLNKEPSFTVLLLKQVWGGSSPRRVYFKRNDSVFSSWVFKTDWPASHNILQMWIQSLTEWKHLQVSMELVSLLFWKQVAVLKNSGTAWGSNLVGRPGSSSALLYWQPGAAGRGKGARGLISAQKTDPG